MHTQTHTPLLFPLLFPEEVLQELKHDHIASIQFNSSPGIGRWYKKIQEIVISFHPPILTKLKPFVREIFMDKACDIDVINGL